VGTRLQQVHESTTRIKSSSAKIPNAVRQLYSLVITGAGTLPEFSNAFQQIPSANLLISNMVGPQQPLYLGGAPLVAFHGLPIVPPGMGLNVTFASINQTICLGIGAAPEAVEDPCQLTRLIADSLAELERAAKPKKARAAPGRRKARKAVVRKPPARREPAKKTPAKRKTQGARRKRS
jgi:hypothetical protein